jgi:hypothetical protein
MLVYCAECWYTVLNVGMVNAGMLNVVTLVIFMLDLVCCMLSC